MDSGDVPPHRRNTEYVRPPAQGPSPADKPSRVRSASNTASSLASAQNPQGTHQNVGGPWLFPSQQSSSLSSPPHPPYTRPPLANHPSPGEPAPSPPTMIGATPTFYDPEQTAPPSAQTYQHFIENYDQGHLVFGEPPPYPAQTAAAAQQQQQQQHPQTASMQPPLRDHYTFVPQSVQAPDPAAYASYFPAENVQRRPMAGRIAARQQQPPPRISHQGRPGANYGPQPPQPHRVSESLHSPVDYAHIPSEVPDSHYYNMPSVDGGGVMDGQYSSLADAQGQHYSSPGEHLTPSVYTPRSDATLPTISPSWTDERPLPTLTGQSSASASQATFRASPSSSKFASKPAKTQKSRKRQKPESDSEDEEDIEGTGANVSRPPDGFPPRLPGACTYCKKLKMKCDFPKNENVCKRCKAGKHHCVVEGRKPRSAPNKREYLLAQIRQKDSIIESLLKQLHNPYLATPLSIEAYRMATPSSDHHRQNVIAWLDRLQSSVRTPGGRGDLRAYKLDSRARSGTDPIAEDDESDVGESDRHHSPEDNQHESDDQPTSAHTLVDPELDGYTGLPDDAVPLGMLANLAISSSKDIVAMGKKPERARGDKAEDDDDVGVANKQYFFPGPSHDLGQRKTLIDKTSPPDILVHGLVTPEDVDKLFEIFYTRVNPFISLLDPKLHTPASTFSRCPFLFTVVCAISSRYSDKPEVYPIAMHFAKSAAANALIDGWKSVELCQAYILMSIYAVPARRWEEDRSWLYTGLAIRIATDLNLHQFSPKKPQNDMEEREMINRTRIWLICFNLDKSTATQFGKPSTVREDFIVRNSVEWYKKSKNNHAYDVHLVAYTSLMRILNKFHHAVFSNADSPSGLNQAIDFHAVTMEHERQLVAYHEEWKERFANDSNPNDDSSSFRCKLLPFYVNYSRLVMFSFGFQKAFLRGLQPEDEIFFTKSLESAKKVVTVLVDSLSPTGYIRYAPDGYFVFAAFASAFLLKLLRPECATFITEGLETEIYDVINRLIQTIGSPQISIDERHTPKLYSRFLAGLLSKHRYDGAARGRLHTQSPPANQPQAGPSGTSYQMPRAGPPSNSPGTASQDLRAHERPQGMTLNTTSLANVFTETASSANEPVYQVEVPYTFGSGALPAPSDAMDFAFDNMRPSGTEDVLAAMRAIDNPGWWSTMMMPGFSWPDEVMSDSTSAHSLYGMNIAANHYNFQPAEVPLSY